MELSILLGRALAVLLLIMGVSTLKNPMHLYNMAKELKENTMLLYLWSLIELTAGLFLVLQHNIWSGWPVIITVFGYLLILEAVIIQLFPKYSIKLALITWREKTALYSGGILAIALGLYLALVSF